MNKNSNYDEKTIAKLWGLAKKGDGKAMGKIYKRMYPRLLPYAMFFLKDLAEGEDVVQDSFYKVLDRMAKEKETQLGSIDNIEVFMKVVIKNGCFTKIGTKKNRQEIIHENIDAIIRDLFSNLEIDTFKIDAPLLEKRIEEILAPKAQVVFYMNLAGCSHKQIAEEVEISLANARYILWAARKKLSQDPLVISVLGYNGSR